MIIQLQSTIQNKDKQKIVDTITSFISDRYWEKRF
jgi:hypothetical protein